MSPAGVRRRAVATASLLAPLLPAIIVGCVGSPDTATDEAPPQPIPRRASEPRPGLVVERLRVRDASAELDVAIASIPEVAPRPEVAERWRREGLLVKVVDEDGLAALETSLGAAVLPTRTWHGEATGWRSASQRRLSRGAVMLQDGRARALNDGVLAFAVRGWSMPLVDGAALQVEIVPHLTAATIDPLAPPVPPGELRGEALTPMIERTLGPGEILLIATVPDRRRATTGSDPESDDPSTDAPTTSDPSTSDGDPASAPESVARRPIGAGPVAAMPPTIGGWLIDDPHARERGVLLLRGRPHPAIGLPGTSNRDADVVVATP